MIGNAVGGGGNVARLAALEAGLPVSVPGLTVDRQCGSGLDAIVLASRLVAAGGGGVLPRRRGGEHQHGAAPGRTATTTANREFFAGPSSRRHAYGDPDMGVAAENVAVHFQVSRGTAGRLRAAQPPPGPGRRGRRRVRRRDSSRSLRRVREPMR